MKIKVKAIGVNRADVFYRQGKYPAFGLEVSGLAKDGRRVMGIVNDGGYAAEVELENGSWVDMPDSMSFIEGASIIEAIYTSYYNLAMLGKLQEFERILIHGGASGIGVVAIQLAKLLGAEVEATAGKPAKLELIESLGATAINYMSLRAKRGNLNVESDCHVADAPRNDEIFGQDKYDLILDMVGADYFNDNLRALKNNGRLGMIAFISGAKANANLAPILLKNLTVFGSMIRTLDNEVKAQIREGFLPFVGEIRPVVDRTFAFAEVNKALDYVEAYKNVGKVVVTV